MTQIVIKNRAAPTPRERRRWLAYREDMAPHLEAWRAAKAAEAAEMERRLQPALAELNAARARLREKYRLPPGEPYTRAAST